MSDPYEVPAGQGGSMATIVFCVVAAALAGLLFGYDTGVAAGIQGYLQQYFHLSNKELGFAIASLELGCVPGAMFAGSLADRFGRKRLLILCAVLFAISGVLSAIPRSLTELVLARVIGGLAIGASSMIAPVYIAEIAPERHRGRLGSLFQLGIVVGIALVYWVNYFILNAGNHINASAHLANAANWNATMGWRWMLGSETLPAILFLLMVVFVPESPRWLVINDQEQRGREILTRFVGSAGAEREIAAVKEVAAQEEGRFSELFAPRYRLPLIIALFLAIFSQFSGINSIIYYAPRVFEAAGMKTSNAFGSTALVGMVNLLFTFIAVGFVDKAGRKLLLAIGTAIQVVSLFCVGLIFALANRITVTVMVHGHSVSHTSIHFSPAQVHILIASVLTFIAAFAMAMGPMPWIIISEIFPARIRGRAASVGVFTLWIAIYVVAQTFPWLKAHAGLTITYFIYSGCSLISFLFVLLVLPETKGKTLEQIEAYWHHRHHGTLPAAQTDHS
ncbi:MAG: sugar porter family MFS transporter [Phycisphaerae bacterium]